MMKKMIFGLWLIALGMVGIVSSNTLSASNIQIENFTEELSNVEKLLVCCEMDAQKIMDLDTALAMLRDGRLQITKVQTGIYRIVTPGGLLILEIEAANL